MAGGRKDDRINYSHLEEILLNLALQLYPHQQHNRFPCKSCWLITERQKQQEIHQILDNTIEIYHWNRFSNQTITIDPHNIIVPDEIRNLHGFEIEMYYLDFMSTVMTFDIYLLEQICSKINATAVVTDVYSNRISVSVLVGIKNVILRGLVPGPGIIFLAVNVPRAKPKSIVSILIDPFDMYTWITYLILVLTMAITLSLFGKLLGRRRFVEIVLELFMISLAGPSRAYGGSFENRMITVFCLMGIVLVSSYQSLVISFMSFARYHPEINTLAEIQDRCLFRDDQDAQFFNFKTYPNGLNGKVDQECFFEMGRDNEERTITVASKLITNKRMFFTEDHIRYRVENFRYANTKFFEYQLCYMINPRLRDKFTFNIQAITESGMYDHYYNNKSQPAWLYKPNTFVDRVVKVGDLTLLWYAYACGNLLSVVSFVMETVIHNEVNGISNPK
ncbi:uncharacterized protein LOC128300262 [Anopheles moucheti]|uniref:uncharacterized protein LOC128300262 n=1 Tax=Anopheles moucheti TaxID=186751 RepID=UPI0022F0F1B0|nr:uncharacterized protein LOC128300262 [Anopheles moucheti]